jgi:hypothetical protein
MAGLAGGVAVVTAAALAVLQPWSAGEPAPFDLASQPAETVRWYRFAESHADLVSRVPCYCGCGKSLGHHSLSDCFMRPDGEGYDSHASACTICLDEARDAERLLAEGRDTDSIRTWINEEYRKYGPPTATQ